MRPKFLLLYLMTIAFGGLIAGAQIKAGSFDAFARSTQMIVVTTPNWDSVEGQMQRFERVSPHAAWQPVSAPIPIVVGRNGLAWGVGVNANYDSHVRSASDPIKKEGDGKAPAGIFDLGTAFGFAEKPLAGSKMPYLTLTPSIECVDDAGSKYYNRIVDRSTVAADWKSSEHMLSVGERYQWGIVVGHNGSVMTDNASPPTPGDGSCVFLHIWLAPQQATTGCTAMSQTNLENLLTWLDPKRNPLLVQLPELKYEQLARRWKLPTP